MRRQEAVGCPVAAVGVSSKRFMSEYRRDLPALLPGSHKRRQVVILRFAFRAPPQRLRLPRDLHAEEASKPTDERPRLGSLGVQRSMHYCIVESQTWFILPRKPRCESPPSSGGGTLNGAPWRFDSATQFRASSNRGLDASGISRTSQSSSIPANRLSGIIQMPNRGPPE